MAPFIDAASQLVNFTESKVDEMGPCPFLGAVCNSPMCHNDTDMYASGVGGDGGRSCDNVDWLPKFRAGFRFTACNTIINAFAVHSMELLSELANAIGRSTEAVALAAQAARTKDAMLVHMYHQPNQPERGGAEGEWKWCDGVCSTMNNHSSFHSQHYALSLGITPPSGVESTLSYLQEQGMVGSTYSANSVITGLYDRAYFLDYGKFHPQK